LNKKLEHFKSSVKRTLTVGGLIGLGLVFLFLGFVEYIPGILNLSRGAAFLLLGAILIFVALIFRAGSKV
jgi:polyferredoxin